MPKIRRKSTQNKSEQTSKEIPPVVKSITGILQGARGYKDPRIIYHKFIEKKYLG